jgi:hypothetical protein
MGYYSDESLPVQKGPPVFKVLNTRSFLARTVLKTTARNPGSPGAVACRGLCCGDSGGSGELGGEVIG